VRAKGGDGRGRGGEGRGEKGRGGEGTGPLPFWKFPDPPPLEYLCLRTEYARRLLIRTYVIRRATSSQEVNEASLHSVINKTVTSYHSQYLMSALLCESYLLQ